MSTTPEGINEVPNHGRGQPEWRDSPPAASENLNSITNDTAAAAPADAAADAPFSPLQSRKHQMYPYLTVEEIDRMRRFGTVQYWRAGELMFEVGVPGPGMFVLLNGRVRVTRRDGLGHVHLVIGGGPRAIPGGSRPVIRQACIGRWSRDRRCGSHPDRAGTPARAAGGRSGTRRADHALADPAARRVDRKRQRADSGRPVGRWTAGIAARISEPQRLSAHRDRRVYRSRSHCVARTDLDIEGGFPAGHLS